MQPFSIPYLSLLFIGGGLCALVVITTFRKCNVRAIAEAPIFLFSIYFAIIHFLTPALKHINGYNRHQAIYDESALIYNSLWCIIVYCFAYFLSRSHAFGPGKLPTKSPVLVGARKAVSAGIMLYAIGALFAWQDLSAIVGEIGFDAFRSDLLAAAEQRSASRFLANLMMLGTAMYVAGWVSRGKAKHIHAVLTGLMFVPPLYYYNTLSSRNSVLIFCILVASAWVGFSSPVAARTTVRIKQNVIVIIASVGLMAGGYYLTLQRYSQFENAYFTARLENVTMYALDGAFGNDEHLIWLSENDYQPYFGFTYLAGVANLIPRWIWPGKPWGAGPELVNLIRPGAYVEGASGNNSYTTGLLVEGRMNFGVPGMFFAVLFWAFITSRATRQLYMSKTLNEKLFFLVTAVVFSTLFLYSEFLGFLGRYIMIIAPLGILIMHARFVKSLAGRLNV